MATSSENHVHVRIQSSADIVRARRQGRAVAVRSGFSTNHLAIIATAISEVARNIIDYAEEGEVIISPIADVHKKGIQIIAADRGPGIADVSTAMRNGYSTSCRLGIGLPGVRRLMDEFEIRSDIGKGTTVTMKKWVASPGGSDRP